VRTKITRWIKRWGCVSDERLTGWCVKWLKNEAIRKKKISQLDQGSESCTSPKIPTSPCLARCVRSEDGGLKSRPTLTKTPVSDDCYRSSCWLQTILLDHQTLVWCSCSLARISSFPNILTFPELLSHPFFLKYDLSPPEVSTEWPWSSFQSPHFTLFCFSIGCFLVIDDSRIFIANNLKYFIKNLRFRPILLSFAFATNSFSRGSRCHHHCSSDLPLVLFLLMLVSYLSNYIYFFVIVYIFFLTAERYQSVSRIIVWGAISRKGNTKLDHTEKKVH
jgi:hypothetical protein